MSNVKYFNMVKEHLNVNEFVLCILLDQNIHNSQLEPEAIMYDRPQRPKRLRVLTIDGGTRVRS